MIAVDTNVWVRYVTNDDPGQASRAMALLAREEVFIPKTVLLELEWVLRGVYGLSAASVQKAMLQILGLPNVRPEQPEQVAQAIGHYAAGLDFADALHLAAGGHAASFHTLDTKFVRRAKSLGLPVESL